jgi:hypothetical protein
MKTTAALILPLTLLSGCLTGSGRLETKSFALADFDSVEIDRDVQLDVTRGDAFSVSITADDNLWGALEVSREGTILRIKLPSDQLLSNVTLRAAVTMPALVSLHASGDSHARLAGFDVSTAPRLDLDASGGSGIEGAVNTDAMSLHLSGGSHATLTGTAASAAIDGSGGSDAGLDGLTAQKASVSLSGNSSGAIVVVGGLDYDLSGGSHLVYSGNPQIGRSDTSGGSSADRR